MFTDRREAGRALGLLLTGRSGWERPVVLGLPRGGVPVAAAVADALLAPLDVIVVRKLGAPRHRELAIGAVGEDGVCVLNDDVIANLRVSPSEVASATDRELAEVDRRAKTYRTVRRREPLSGRTALVVDDGIATGATARAACQVAREHGASRIVLAVPVAPSGWRRTVRDVADECFSVEEPRDFVAVGTHYEDFAPTSDDEVLDVLRSAREDRPC